MSKERIFISTLLNIDSNDRNKTPKNICISDNKTLPINPISLIKNSDIAKFNYPNHNLNTGDNIIIQNVEGISKTINQCITLINNFNYFVINFPNNNIPLDYKLYCESILINIELFGEKKINNMIDNIPLNNLLGIKKALLFNDLPNLIKLEIIKFIPNNSNTEFINENYLFIELSQKYFSSLITTNNLNQVFKISYLQIGGIKLGYFNSNYPINEINFQSCYSVEIIDTNYFQIKLNFKSFNNINGGGKNIYISKIIDTIEGYPNVDNYVINLKKSFDNVVRIELFSTEFPFIDLLVKKNINDKLYWKNIEDGDFIYSLQIEEGVYNSVNLLNKIESEIQKIPRINNSLKNSKFNLFDVNFEPNIQKVSFKPFDKLNLPNSLSLFIETIDNIQYLVLSILFTSYIDLIKNDEITISNSLDLTLDKNGEYLLLNQNLINKKHSIYKVQSEDKTCFIIIGELSEIQLNNTSNQSYGGNNILIKIPTKVSFLFNKKDTIGDILGFKNTGELFSITNFSSNISNKDPYYFSSNINVDSKDVVGNPITYSSGFLNLSGKNNYFLMYLNDIEYIYSNSLDAAFAKILLSGNPGDILYNTFVPIPQNIYSKNFPISTLTELTIKFLYPDGSPVNFRNINHSFTLNIIEEQNINNDTHLNSQNISISDEFKKLIKK